MIAMIAAGCGLNTRPRTLSANLTYRGTNSRPDKRDFSDQFLDEQAAKRIEVLCDKVASRG